MLPGVGEASLPPRILCDFSWRMSQVVLPLGSGTERDSLALPPCSESLAMVRALTRKGGSGQLSGARRDSQFALYRLTLSYEKELPTKIKYCQGWRDIEGQDVTEPPTC